MDVLKFLITQAKLMFAKEEVEQHNTSISVRAKSKHVTLLPNVLASFTVR